MVGEIRKKHGIARAVLAEETNYSTRQLARIEKGESRLSPEAVVLFSETLHDEQLLKDFCLTCPVGCKLMGKKNPALGETG